MVNTTIAIEYGWQETETFSASAIHSSCLFSSLSISDRRVNATDTVQSGSNIPVLFVCFAWLESNLAQLQAGWQWHAKQIDVMHEIGMSAQLLSGSFKGKYFLLHL